jgi:hypothetical protein
MVESCTMIALMTVMPWYDNGASYVHVVHWEQKIEQMPEMYGPVASPIIDNS